MTNLEIIKLRENTKVRVMSHVDCAPGYKKTCLLTFWDAKRRGYTEVNEDTGELEVNYPWGVSTPNGVCYMFPAEVIERVY